MYIFSITSVLGFIIAATSSVHLLFSLFFVDRGTVFLRLCPLSEKCLYKSNLFIFHCFTLNECQLCAASMVALSQ